MNQTLLIYSEKKNIKLFYKENRTKPSELITKIENNEFDSELKKLYVSDSAVNAQKPRHIRTINEFIKLFGDDRGCD